MMIFVWMVEGVSIFSLRLRQGALHLKCFPGLQPSKRKHHPRALKGVPSAPEVLNPTSTSISIYIYISLSVSTSTSRSISKSKTLSLKPCILKA